MALRIETQISLELKFADLFAGIGGFHLAALRNGLTCTFACERDKFCRETYAKNFAVDPFYKDFEDIKKKIRTRKVLFSIFLVLTIAFLIGAIVGAIVNQDDLLPYLMTAILGIFCVITLTLTIVFGVKFRRLGKENASIEN